MLALGIGGLVFISSAGVFVSEGAWTPSSCESIGRSAVCLLSATRAGIHVGVLAYRHALPARPALRLDLRAIFSNPPGHPRRSMRAASMWTKPEYTDLRIGFEVTLYFANR
jgi:coenzyme PQQ precursor peptide PqqA